MSNSHLFLTPRFIKTPSQNGVGRYVCQLQRVVLKFCKSNGSSRGMRDFIESEVVNYAKDNPNVVMYLKPRRHHSPLITAEYLNGDRQVINCHNFSKEEISKWMCLVTTQAGNSEGTRLRKLQHTDFPSIQGPWTPFTFADPSLNITDFPNMKISQQSNQSQTTTEKLLEIFERQQKDEEDLDKNRAK